MSPNVATALATVACSSLSAFLGAYLAVVACWPGELQQEDESFAAHISASLRPQDAVPSENAPMAEPSVPRRLPDAITAAALPNDESLKDNPIRSLVHGEMPAATPEEIDAWSEALQGLEVQTAREILRLRNAISKPRRRADEPLTSPSSGPRGG